MYIIEFGTYAKEDLEYWETHNSRMLVKIDKLIENIKLTPFSGIGKPEPLKHDRTGFWSRRIDSKHRLVYKIHRNIIFIAQCRYHY